MATNLIPLNPGETRAVRIGEAIDSATAQQTAREFARALGFLETAAEEIVIVAAELASNLVKHAGRGTLAFRALHAQGQIGIEIRAEDSGPGIENIERSIADGYSTAGSLGYGLGTVNRLMDEIDIASAPGLGTCITCQRWRSTEIATRGPLRWQTGVVTRSRQFAPHNGDAYIVRESRNALLAGLIDGLGHGAHAQQAALAAQRYVQSHADLPLDKLFRGADRACRATRGVVMALARLDSAGISIASVGNIEARVWAGANRVRLNVQRGIVGLNESTVTIQQHKWNPGWMLVLHTDGLYAHWQWHDFPGIEHEPAQFVAAKLMRALASEDDDATVLVVRTQPQ